MFLGAPIFKPIKVSENLVIVMENFSKICIKTFVTPCVSSRLISVKDVRNSFRSFYSYFNFCLLFIFSIICQTPDSNI